MNEMTQTERRTALLISGLRRSGTTALWEIFRTAPAITAFDEPFHPRLWTGVRDNPKGTWPELTSLWGTGPRDLVPNVTPITPLDELTSDLTPAQLLYLQTLLTQGRTVVIDVVRHWNKLAALSAADPNLHIVLLVRSPVPWVLSHLLPSGGTGWRFLLGTKLRRATALWRRGNFDNWQYETIIDAALAQRHRVLEGMTLSPTALQSESAHVKLLAFWWAANRNSYRDLLSHAAGRFDVLLAEDFMSNPVTVAETLMSRGKFKHQTLDYKSIRAPGKDPLQNDRSWMRAFDRLNIPRCLLPEAAPTSATLRAALDSSLS